MTSFGLECFDDDDVSENELSNNLLTIRPFNTEDIDALNEQMRHIRLVEADIPTCYIAENKDHQPVFRQWVFRDTQNHRIQNYFGESFPILEKNEALLEGGFTHPNYRGKRIMAKAILNIMQLDVYNDVKRYITFVDESNIASIKGLYRAGFKPYILRHEKWLFFKRKVSFTTISSEIEIPVSILIR